MTRFLIDANLPRYFAIWNSSAFEFAHDLKTSATDQEIWDHALLHDLTIVTKDADFTDRMLVAKECPRVIHFRIGNMKLRDLHDFLHRNWDELTALSASYRLVTVYVDRVECMS